MEARAAGWICRPRACSTAVPIVAARRSTTFDGRLSACGEGAELRLSTADGVATSALAPLCDTYRVTALDVPFELVENQVVAGFTIGGRGPYVCLLDTAVDPSVVDLALARELGLDVRDDAPGEAAGQGSEPTAFYPSELPDVRLGEFEVGDVEAVAADLSGLGSKLNRPLHAILGQSFFDGHVVQFDYRNRRVRFNAHSFERGVRADIEGAADLTPIVTVHVNAATVPVVLDTGSSLTLGIYLESVEKLGLGEAFASATPRASMGARGHIDAYEGAVHSLALGDVHLSPAAVVFLPRAHVDPTPRALGNLGNGFLQHTVLTLDYPRRELYIAAAT
ncbi:MAG: pepsin/retropepsin-like aspartic protease family protein [Gaiellaceae bacterium]